MLRDWTSSGDNVCTITRGWVVMVASNFISLPAGPVFILATLFSFTIKLAGTNGGGISKVWGLFAGKGCTILGGPVKDQQELHG